MLKQEVFISVLFCWILSMNPVWFGVNELIKWVNDCWEMGVSFLTCIVRRHYRVAKKTYQCSYAANFLYKDYKLPRLHLYVPCYQIIICTLFILYVSVSLVSFTMVCICIKLTVFYFKIDVSSSSVKILFLLKIYTSCRFQCFRPILYFLMNLKQYSIPCFRHFSDVTIIDLCTEVMVLQLKEQWIDKS